MPTVRIPQLIITVANSGKDRIGIGRIAQLAAQAIASHLGHLDALKVGCSSWLAFDQHVKSLPVGTSAPIPGVRCVVESGAVGQVGAG
jgi:hypothetical protein